MVFMSEVVNLELKVISPVTKHEIIDHFSQLKGIASGILI